jgi:AraC family transcriptional regulator
MPSERDILQLLRHIRGRLDDDVSLDRLAARAGWSPFHFHRAFRKVVGETPKQYTQRLRLERAAARLATGAEPVLAIAAAEGFASHEVFTRAFRRHFGCTPSAYRDSALRDTPARARARHVAITGTTGPCVGLFHLPINQPLRRTMMPTLSIERRELTERPVVFVSLRAARHEIPAAIAEGAGKTYMYAQKAGAAIAGHPFTRYLSTGPGLFNMEIGIPLAAAAPGEGEVKPGVLPAGLAAVAVHAGPYDQLGETYAALERWIETNGLRPAGPPWEWYTTDPAEHPDPADWRTEVYWPVAGYLPAPS